jgi:hypothetical protein
MSSLVPAIMPSYKLGQFLLKYLGVPVNDRPLRTADWDFLSKLATFFFLLVHDPYHEHLAFVKIDLQSQHILRAKVKKFEVRDFLRTLFCAVASLL